MLKQIKLATNQLKVEEITNIKIYIGGGSALSLTINKLRASKDIDIVESLGSDNVRKILRDFNINDDVATSIEGFRENFGFVERTSELLFKDDNIEWFAVWPEVIYISKKFSNREKDKQDIDYMKNNHLSKTKMQEAINSVREYRLIDHSKDAVDNELNMTIKEIKKEIKWKE